MVVSTCLRCINRREAVRRSWRAKDRRRGTRCMKTVFDPNPGHRTECEWRQLLGELVDSLSGYAGIRFGSTSYFVEDQAGHACARGCADIRGVVSRVLRIDAC